MHNSNYSVLKLLIYLGLAGVLSACAHSPAQQSQSLKLLHFSDYHSSALEQVNDQGKAVGGIARAIAFIKSKANGDTLIFNGGDMMNKGAPVWSDKYQCSEWPWFNGLIDAMALGNHDSDYGPAVLQDCLKQIDYPVLSANTFNREGLPAFKHNDQNYVVFEVGSYTVGVFAVAGDDFGKLIKASTAPLEAVQYGNKTEAARQVVASLRNAENVDMVVLLGHSHYEEDLELAREVKGIDLILGSHSHRREELFVIPETTTWYVSAGQYLTHIAEVDIQLSKKDTAESNIDSIKAKLVAMDESIVPDQETQKRVAAMQTALQSDPDYAAHFAVIGQTSRRLNAPVKFDRDSLLGNFASDAVRISSDADIAMFTSSTFRKSIPSGTIRAHHLSDAMPYDNKLHKYELSGAQVKQLLKVSVQRMGSDFFSQVSGLKIQIVGGKVDQVSVQHNQGWQALEEDGVYSLVSSDYQTKVATGYADVFAGKPYTVLEPTLRQMVRNALLQGNVPVVLDGRIQAR